MQAVLLGSPETKRTIYLKKAADQEDLPLLFLDWKNWRETRPEGPVYLKIDPPKWESSSLRELRNLTEAYRQELSEAEVIWKGQGAKFLNTPRAICSLLDKRGCKETLVKAGVPVTEILNPPEGSSIACGADLIGAMRELKVFQVFVKPVSGSGAAGIGALRLHPGGKAMALYTCAYLTGEGKLYNTKRLRCRRDPEEILNILDVLLSMDCVVERWYAKEEYQGYSYDLRAVVQEGKMDFLLARLSQGPITNLHLNNRPLKIEELRLPEYLLDHIFQCCERAMECFPGLSTAGIDILLEKGSRNPRIIEMNGQGDLIYQDIYNDNRIYRHQAEIMKRGLRERRSFVRRPVV